MEEKQCPDFRPAPHCCRVTRPPKPSLFKDVRAPRSHRGNTYFPRVVMGTQPGIILTVATHTHTQWDRNKQEHSWCACQDVHKHTHIFMTPQTDTHNKQWQATKRGSPGQKTIWDEANIWGKGHSTIIEQIQLSVWLCVLGGGRYCWWQWDVIRVSRLAQQGEWQ